MENCPLYPIPPLFGTPLGVIQSDVCRDFWRQKTTRVPGLSYGIAHVILGSAILVELKSCDRRMDIQTDGRHTMTAYTVLA